MPTAYRAKLAAFAARKDIIAAKNPGFIWGF